MPRRRNGLTAMVAVKRANAAMRGDNDINSLMWSSTPKSEYLGSVRDRP